LIQLHLALLEGKEEEIEVVIEEIEVVSDLVIEEIEVVIEATEVVFEEEIEVVIEETFEAVSVEATAEVVLTLLEARSPEPKKLLMIN